MKLKQKPLKDLNLLDRFLFAQAADDPDTMRDILENHLRESGCIKTADPDGKGTALPSFKPLCAAGCMGHG